MNTCFFLPSVNDGIQFVHVVGIQKDAILDDARQKHLEPATEPLRGKHGGFQYERHLEIVSISHGKNGGGCGTTYTILKLIVGDY